MEHVKVSLFLVTYRIVFLKKDVMVLPGLRCIKLLLVCLIINFYGHGLNNDNKRQKIINTGEYKKTASTIFMQFDNNSTGGQGGIVFLYTNGVIDEIQTWPESIENDNGDFMETPIHDIFTLINKHINGRHAFMPELIYNTNSAIISFEFKDPIDVYLLYVALVNYFDNDVFEVRGPIKNMVKQKIKRLAAVVITLLIEGVSHVVETMIVNVIDSYFSGMKELSIYYPQKLIDLTYLNKSF